MRDQELRDIAAEIMNAQGDVGPVVGSRFEKPLRMLTELIRKREADGVIDRLKNGAKNLTGSEHYD